MTTLSIPRKEFRVPNGRFRNKMKIQELVNVQFLLFFVKFIVSKHGSGYFKFNSKADTVVSENVRADQRRSCSG